MWESINVLCVCLWCARDRCIILSHGQFNSVYVCVCVCEIKCYFRQLWRMWIEQETVLESTWKLFISIWIKWTFFSYQCDAFFCLWIILIIIEWILEILCVCVFFLDSSSYLLCFAEKISIENSQLSQLKCDCYNDNNIKPCFNCSFVWFLHVNKIAILIHCT